MTRRPRVAGGLSSAFVRRCFRCNRSSIDPDRFGSALCCSLPWRSGIGFCNRGSRRRPSAASDFQLPNRLSFPCKWTCRSANGGFLRLFAFSGSRLKLTFSRPVKIKESAIFNVQHLHPLRGTARVEHPRPSRAVGAVRHARIVTSSTELRRTPLSASDTEAATSDGLP